MGLLGYDQECFDRFKRHMDKIMENTPHKAQKAISKEQGTERFRIPKITVKDIFGEVIMSELARKRKATGPCELPKKKRVSTESQNHNNTEADEDNVTCHIGDRDEETECTEGNSAKNSDRQQKDTTEQAEQEHRDEIVEPTNEQDEQEKSRDRQEEIEEQECIQEMEESNTEQNKGREEIVEAEPECIQGMDESNDKQDKDRDEIEEQVGKDRQQEKMKEQVSKDRQNKEPEEVAEEEISTAKESNKEHILKQREESKGQTEEQSEQNQAMGKELAVQIKEQNSKLCIQVFAVVDSVNSDSHQFQVTNCASQLMPGYSRRTTGPVPEDQQDGKIFYCHKCSNNYKE